MENTNYTYDLTGKKFLMILLYSPQGDKPDINTPIIGRTRLMKMGFLFEKEVRREFEKDKVFRSIKMPTFFPWYYGPFSKDLLNDLEFLINRQYVDVKLSNKSSIPEEVAEYEYWIEDIDESDASEFCAEIFTLSNPKGISKASEIWNKLSDNQKALMRKFKYSLYNTPLSKILEYVYRKYKVDGVTLKSRLKHKYTI